MIPIKTVKSNFTYVGDGRVVADLPCERIKHGWIRTVWRLTDEERKAVASGADISLDIFTEPVPPVNLDLSFEESVDAPTTVTVDFQNQQDLDLFKEKYTSIQVGPTQLETVIYTSYKRIFDSLLKDFGGKIV